MTMPHTLDSLWWVDEGGYRKFDIVDLGTVQRWGSWTIYFPGVFSSYIIRLQWASPSCAVLQPHRTIVPALFPGPLRRFFEDMGLLDWEWDLSQWKDCLLRRAIYARKVRSWVSRGSRLEPEYTLLKGISSWTSNFLTIAPHREPMIIYNQSPISPNPIFGHELISTMTGYLQWMNWTSCSKYREDRLRIAKAWCCALLVESVWVRWSCSVERS